MAATSLSRLPTTYLTNVTVITDYVVLSLVVRELASLLE